jgi:hypothetical protein
LLRKLENLSDGVVAVAISADGRTLASAGLKEPAVRLWDVFSGKQIAKFDGHRGAVRSLAFSPDGSTLASGSVDTTILLWDVRKLTPPIPATQPDEMELQQLWVGLQDRDPARAFKSILPLAGAGDVATGFLKARVKPIPELDAKRVETLLAELNADEQPVRSAATQELRKLGRLVEPALRQHLMETTTPKEVEVRIQGILDDLPAAKPDPDEQTALRAVTVLEQIGSPAARALLKELAGGAKGADLTRTARLALECLDRLKKDR